MAPTSPKVWILSSQNLAIRYRSEGLEGEIDFAEARLGWREFLRLRALSALRPAA